MQKNYVTRLTAKDRGHAAATIEDSAQHDYAALTLLVPGQAVHTVLWLRLRTSLFQSKDEPEGIEG